MSDPNGRLPRLTPGDLEADQLELYNTMVGERGNIGDENGRLYGPFNVWLYNPDAGRHLFEVGGSLRNDTAIDRGLNELAICVTAGYWRTNFPFQSHAVLARKFGIPDAILDALAVGERPRLEDERHEIVYEVASSLVRTSTLDDELYTRAREAFGDRQLVELVLICGWYTLTAFVTTTFRTSAPANFQPVFGAGGRTEGASSG